MGDHGSTGWAHYVGDFCGAFFLDGVVFLRAVGLGWRGGQQAEQFWGRMLGELSAADDGEVGAVLHQEQRRRHGRNQGRIMNLLLQGGEGHGVRGAKGGKERDGGKV